ncbi:MAG: adenosylcobinamide-GDP ribazoletransferase [Magnetococcus sp. DMHC-8]
MPIRPLLIAIGLLTRLPILLRTPPSEQELGRSVLAYPVVGGLLGILLATCAPLIPFQGVDLRAALLLAGWVWMTGGLHLDGLADAADAWAGGMGSRERTLAIMKDVHNGPMAVIVLILLLLIKFAAIKELLLADRGWLLALPPLLGRTGILLLFLTLPYVRTGGMGALAAAVLPRRGGWLLLGLIGAGCLSLFGRMGGLALLVCLGMFWLLRRLMWRRLGGTTGDTAGALCELLELAALLALAGG